MGAPHGHDQAPVLPGAKNFWMNTRSTGVRTTRPSISRSTKKTSSKSMAASELPSLVDMNRLSVSSLVSAKSFSGMLTEPFAAVCARSM